MAIETTHRSYTIKFHENGETWSCHELDIFTMPTLKATKAAIDRLSAKDRRLDVKALFVTGRAGRFNDTPVVEEVTVTILCSPKMGHGKGAKEEVKQCWIVNAKGERAKVAIENLFPLDHRADINGWLALAAAADRAVKMADAAQDALTRHTADSLALADREAKAEKKEAAE